MMDLCSKWFRNDGVRAVDHHGVTIAMSTSGTADTIKTISKHITGFGGLVCDKGLDSLERQAIYSRLKSFGGNETMTEYLRMEQKYVDRRITPIYNVWSIESDLFLGCFHWYAPWRKYVWQVADEDVIMSKECDLEKWEKLEAFEKERKKLKCLWEG